MPALAPVPSTARVVTHGTLGGLACLNVFHVRLATDFLIQTDVDALASGFRAAFASRFVTQLSTSYVLGTVTAQAIDSPLGPLGSAPGSTTGGSGTGSNVSASTAICISWHIARNYRGGHPRTYLGGLITSQISTPNSISGAFATALQTAATGFIADIKAIVVPGGHSAELVCVHRVKDGVQLADPLVDVITSAAVDTRIDSMRRRLGPDR